MNRHTILKALQEYDFPSRWIHKNGMKIQQFNIPLDWEYRVFEWNNDNRIVHLTSIWLCRSFLIIHGNGSMYVKLKFNDIENFSIKWFDIE